MAKGKKAAKKEKAGRTRMSDEQVSAFVKKWAKDHDYKGKELEQHLKRVAATRLAALDRYQSKQA